MIKAGLIDSSEAFGKIADYESRILKVGRNETPFLSSISSMAPSNRDGSVAAGHMWFYDQLPDGLGHDDPSTASDEGGRMSSVNHYIGKRLENHYQILKQAFGVTGSEAEAMRVNGQKVIAAQREQALIQFKKTLEKILLSEQTAVPRVNTSGAKVAGKCGGLKSFATAANKIDASNAELTWDSIRELLKIGYMNGSPYKILMMNDKQKDRLDDIIFSKAHVSGLNTSRIDNNVTHIGNTAYGTNIQVMLSPYLKDDEIIALKPDDIVKVNWRPMAEKKRETTDDAELYEIINEFTLRVCTPYAFAWLHNLKV